MNRPEYEAALRGAAAAVEGQRVEYAVVLDVEGVVVWTGKGNVSSVCVPDGTEGCVVVHNHPGGGPLSYDDVATAYNGKHLETVAVGPWITYRLGPTMPGAPWPSLSPVARDLLARWKRGALLGDDACWALVRLVPGLSYVRLPTRAWIRGATFTAPAMGPAQELPR